jgi:hypothetical protein
MKHTGIGHRYCFKCNAVISQGDNYEIIRGEIYCSQCIIPAQTIEQEKPMNEIPGIKIRESSRRVGDIIVMYLFDQEWREVGTISNVIASPENLHEVVHNLKMNNDISFINFIRGHDNAIAFCNVAIDRNDCLAFVFNKEAGDRERKIYDALEIAELMEEMPADHWHVVKLTLPNGKLRYGINRHFKWCASGDTVLEVFREAKNKGWKLG